MPIDTSPLEIALLQLYSNGDCLFATIIAHQIKTDYPNSKLTWYIASNCKSIIDNNSNIDTIVSIDIKGKDAKEEWFKQSKIIKSKQNCGEYDLFFSTQIIDENEANYNGTIRGTIINNYPNKITVSLQPQLFLTDIEIEHVEHFVKKNNFSGFKNVVLFECAPVSGQIKLNPKIATEMAELILTEINDTCFILTSGEKINSNNNNIFDASVLTIRENAELINHCSHFIGCSSGISWLNTSTWCKPLPILQMLDNKSFYFNSMCRDYKFHNLDSSLITEIKYKNVGSINQIIVEFIEDHKTAKEKYHIELNDRSTTIYTLCRRFIASHKLNAAFSIVRKNYFLNRNNWHYYFKVTKLLIFSPFFYLSYYYKRLFKWL